MKYLLKYLRGYARESICAPLFKMLEAFFELFVPLVVAAIIDNGIGSGDKGYIVRMCLLLLALAVVGLASSLTAQFFAAKAATGFGTKVRHALFAKIQSLSFPQLDKAGLSTLITRMTGDVNQVQSGVNLVLRLFLRSPFIVFGAMIMAFTVDVRAAWIFVVTIPALSVVVFGVMLAGIPLYKKVQSALDSVLGITRENINGARVIRAFCGEESEIAEFDRRTEALTRIQKLVGGISAVMSPATYIIVNAAIIALIWVGAIRVNSGALTQGQVVALYNYMSQILVELVKLANLIITVTKAWASGNRISAVLSMSADMLSPEASPVRTDTSVEFDGVSLKYPGAGDEALSNISFRAEAGETIGVIGGTGAGKSSLVNLIPRFYDASKGSVKVNGADVRDYPTEELRALIGVVPQKAVLFKGSIRDNLLWGKRDADDSELMDAVRTAQAEDVVEAKGGLGAKLSQGGSNLSGGQRQRLTIARALVRKPQILILDDSSSALDFATDARLRKAIRENTGDAIVFIVSQRTSSIMNADKIIVIEDGEAVGIGTHEELLKSCEIYREIHNSQQGGVSA